jgi:hypothetical protein
MGWHLRVYLRRMRLIDAAGRWSLTLGTLTALASSCSSGSSKNSEPNPYRGGAGGTGGSGGAGATGGKSATGGTVGDAGDPGSGATAGDPGAGGTGGSTGGSGGSAGLPTGAGIGDDCSSAVRCRVGLECVDSACTPSGDGELGEPCVVQPECGDGLVCIGGTCNPEGEGRNDDACTSDGDCAAGLKCLLSGLSGHCTQQGTGDLGDTCAVSAECYGGLACIGDTCAPQPTTGPLWPGVECEEPTSNVRAYFEVPGANAAQEGDFFRLPFPNDARRGATGLDLSGFPTPGPGLLGVDPVALYVDALEQNDSGWGTYSTVMFRFSGVLDIATLRMENVAGWVDITPDVPEYGSSVGLGWYYNSGRTPYVCDNWIAARRPTGWPLLPNHTYAVWITTGVKAEGGATIARAANLVSVLANAAPSDPALVPVHAAYAPFRAYLADNAISPASILTATVFTVGPTQDAMTSIADAVEDAPAPTASDWTLCDDGVDSPCPDATGERGCVAAAADYDEYHALVTLPIFQNGTAPYLTPDDGGEIGDVDNPSSAEVCLSLTVPKGNPPASGFPLVVYAHGTGGSFRDHVSPSVAGALSTATPAFAVLGIDQVTHGPRRGASMQSPNELFFNFLNPKAARGNPLQGAADQLSLMKFAATIDGSGDMPTTIDPDRLYFFGHSQGSTEGSLMLPFADGYKAAVLSGNGGSLMNALLSKSEPVNLRSVLPIALSDPTVAGGLGEVHPVLSLLQQWIDPADPMNFARNVVRVPLAGHPAKHVFQTYGLDDHYSPPITLDVYSIAAQLTQVEPILTEIGLLEAMPPLSANESMGMITAGVRQYDPPSNSDGHFVVFDVPQANEDVVRFLSMAASGEVPEIGE